MAEDKWDAVYDIACRTEWNVETMITAVCLVLLCRDFVNWERFGKRKWGMALIGGIYFCVYMGLYWLPGWGSYSVNIIALSAVFAVCLIFDRKNIRLKIFLLCTFLVICWMVRSMTGTVIYYLVDWTDRRIYDWAGRDNPFLQTYYYIVFFVYLFVCQLLRGAALYLVVRLIRRAFAGRRQEMTRQEFFVLMIPVVNGMTAHSLMRVYSDAYEKETGSFMYQTHPASEYLWLLYYVIIIAAIISMIVLYQKIRIKQEEESAGRMLESEVRDIRAHIAEVEKLYTEIRSIRHDMKNHIEVMKGLLAQEKTAEMGEYFNRLSAIADTFDFSIKSGNPVTDVIILEKMREAKERGIEFISEFHYPEDCGMDAFDISVILSNALSNAMEAVSAKGGGTVRLSSFRNKKAYLITVENSFDGFLDLDEEKGFPKTSKSDKKFHGIGFQNMKSAAEKYYGDVLLEQKGDKVVLTVMLMAG